MTERSLPEILAADRDAKLERLRQACEQAGHAWPSSAAFEETLGRVLAFSDFAAESLEREPRLLSELHAPGAVDRPAAPGEVDARLAAALVGVADIDDISARLRHFRRREMVRIAWRDLAGAADLSETTADLSALAEACLHRTLAFLQRQQCDQFGAPTHPDGAPMGLVVLALGKLGARELNFSSDIDLILAYSGEASGSPCALSHEEFFTRLARRLIQVLGRPDADGMVFRVDLRLRPFGDNGPLVLSFDAMEQYYQEQGRDWERYAWIKARAVAGDRTAGKALLRRLAPFVYRRYLDFGAFESLRAMKQMITQEVARKGLQDDIKLGPGGIREVEFFGQMFQLIRGGVSPELRKRPIREVLASLVATGCIPAAVRDDLDAAYVFLRRVEHRLQAVADRQTHALPADALGRVRLSAAMGFEDPSEFAAELDRHRAAVHGHFRMLLEAPAAEGANGGLEADAAAVWQQRLGTAESEAVLARCGFDAPGEALRLLDELRGDPDTPRLSLVGRQRLDRLVPAVLTETGRAGHALTTLGRVVDLIRAIERRPSYLALLLEYPAALEHLVRLADASPWIASFLAQHPVLLDELLDPRTLYRPPTRAEIAVDLRRRLERAPADDLEAQIEELCIFKQTNVLRVAAADVSGRLPLMRVSDYLSDIAEVAIDAVVDLAWQHLVERHGPPSGGGEGSARRGFAVIAYGKLGGLELGYASDLDLVFLHGGEGQTTGSQPIDEAQFYNRLGQRVIHLLTSHTRAGRVYDIDTRLRASGSSGILVQHVEGFRDYQLHEAWTWEHQALIKARPVSGDERIAARFQAIRAEVLSRARNRAELRQEVADMRERMRRERRRPEPGMFDLKQDPGGIIDIEFLVQYLTLRHARRTPELMRWTDTVRLIQTLIGSAVLDEITAHVLRHAYLIYRAAAHQLSLQEKPARVPSEKFRALQPRIERIYRSVLGTD